MADLFQQRSIDVPLSGRRDLFAERGITIEPPAESDGVTGPVSALENIGQGFNRGLGSLVRGADYALLGFLDDTDGGRSKRPLGYLSQVLAGERNIPGTDQKFAHEPTTPGERMLQRGGEVLGESLPAASVMAAPARMAMRPASGAFEQALQFLSKGQASSAALAGEATGAVGSGIGEEIGRSAAPDSIAGPIIGSIVGGLTPAAASMPAVRSSARRMANAVGNYTSPRASARRAKAKVLEEIGPHIGDEATQARLREAEDIRAQIEGFDPDLAQATRSEALKETKRDIVRRASGAELEDIRKREAASEAAIEEFAKRQAPEAAPSADPDTPQASLAVEPLVAEREAAARQVRDIEAQRSGIPEAKRAQELAVQEQAEVRLESLRERERALPAATDITETQRLAMEDLTSRTQGARADVAGRLNRIDRSAEGKKIRESIRAERQSRLDEISKLSKDFGLDDVGLNDAMASFHRDVRRWQSGLLPSERDNMPSVMKDVASLGARARKAIGEGDVVSADGTTIRVKTKPITFKNIKSLRESANRAVLEASRDTSPGHRIRLANAVELRRRIDDDLLTEDLIDSDGYRQFRRAYFEKIVEPFERGQVKKTTTKDGTGFFRTLDEEVGLGFLESKDAAEQIRRIAETQPELMASIEAVGLDDLASKVVVDGAISLRALESWIERRSAALGQLPGLRKTVADIAAAARDVEGRFARGKKVIRERTGAERQRVAGQRRAIAEERQKVQKAASGEKRRIGQEATEQQARLQGAMQPLLERMGVQSERKMALEDSQLARRLGAISGGTAKPTAVIDDALEDPGLMRKLWKATEAHPDARKALQRHVWDQAASLDAGDINDFLEANRKSLGIVFGKKHLDSLDIISQAKVIQDFAQFGGQAKPITASLNDKIQQTTGLNVSALAATGAAVSRGRSSKTVEGLRVLFQILTERGRQGYEKLMREALFNPDVAKGLIESAQFGPRRPQKTTLEDFANRRLKGWLWNLGISSPISQESDEERRP